MAGFFIPVFVSGILDNDITIEQGKGRARVYLFYEFLLSATITLLTLLVWIPGHTHESIAFLMSRRERKKQKEELRKQKDLSKQLLKQKFDKEVINGTEENNQ